MAAMVGWAGWLLRGGSLDNGVYSLPPLGDVGWSTMCGSIQWSLQVYKSTRVAPALTPPSPRVDETEKGDVPQIHGTFTATRTQDTYGQEVMSM